MLEPAKRVGSQGPLEAGDEIEVKDYFARELVERGVVEIVHEGVGEETEDAPSTSELLKESIKDYKYRLGYFKHRSMTCIDCGDPVERNWGSRKKPLCHICYLVRNSSRRNE